MPDSIRKGYFKVKILELLLFLSAMPEEAETKQHLYPARRSLLAKAVCTYLTAHGLPHPARAARQAPPRLRHKIKPVSARVRRLLFAYTRRQKMEAAALMLAGNRPLCAEVAGCFGYDNGSKFSKAFMTLWARRRPNTAHTPL